MADIFVSYTSSDRNWAFWIGQELERLGHVAHIHEWEIDAGGNIPAWMQEREEAADHTLCVISNAYLSRPYSSWELQAAQWAAASDRPNFMLPVFVEECKAPILLAPFKRCDLFGLNENEARARLEAYLKPAAKPSGLAQFPGAGEKGSLPHPAVTAFPGSRGEFSNSPAATGEKSSGRRDAHAEINKDGRRDEGGASPAVVGVSWLPRVVGGPLLRLVAIGVFAIGVLAIIVWLLSRPHFAETVIQRTDGAGSPAQNGNGNSVIINGKP